MTAPRPDGDAGETDQDSLILFTQYAIGQKLISQAEVDALRAAYYVQSQFALGMVIPLALLAFAERASGGVVAGWGAVIATGIVAILMLAIGMDRLHKYYSELQSLIASRYAAAAQTKTEARKQAMHGVAS